MKSLILKFCCLLWSFGRATYYRDMADAFRRKVSMRDFIERELTNTRLLKDSTGNTVMRFLASRYASGMGGSLCELMAGVAPASDQMLLAAVDDAKDKAAALEKAADAVAFQIRSVKTLARNLVTPLVSVPLVGALCLITSDIVVGIAETAPPAVWTGFNGLVRALAEFINSYWLGILGGMVGAVALLLYQLPRWIGSLRLKFDNLPGFSLYRDYNAAVVLSALAMMIGAGKTMRQALEDLHSNSPRWLRWQLMRVLNSLEDDPTDYLSAFSRGLMPISVRARLGSLLDSSKSFDAALITLGTSEVKRLETNVEVSAATVNWTLTGIMVTLAVILSMGQMTIASALSREADPAKMMQSRQP